MNNIIFECTYINIKFRYKSNYIVFKVRGIYLNLRMNVIFVCFMLFIESVKKYMPSLRKASFNPVNVSQLLYSERCIDETTLDKAEMLEGSLYDKRTLVLEAVSADHKKFKVLLTVLLKFDETRGLAESIY